MCGCESVKGCRFLCNNHTYSLSPPRKSALQWVLHMTGLSIPSPPGLLSWNQICTYFLLANQCKWECFLNGCLKRKDFAEHVTLLLPTCASFIFIRVASHFHTWNPLNWQITFSANCTTSVILIGFGCWNAEMKELLSIRADEDVSQQITPIQINV